MLSYTRTERRVQLIFLFWSNFRWCFARTLHRDFTSPPSDRAAPIACDGVHNSPLGSFCLSAKASLIRWLLSFPTKAVLLQEPWIAIRSDCGWVEVSLSRYKVIACKVAVLLCGIDISRSDNFSSQKEGWSRSKNYRLGVSAVWLFCIGKYLFAVILHRRYLACFLCKIT